MRHVGRRTDPQDIATQEQIWQSAAKNKIINGDMNISQRGSSFSGVSSSTYSLDRWFCGASTSAVVTISQQQDAPVGSDFQRCLQVLVTTNSSVISVGHVLNIHQRIEGFNIADLVGKTFTFSFWVKSSVSGIHCVSFANGGLDRSFVAEYTVNSANTWERKVVTVLGGLPTSGTWNYAEGYGLRVAFALATSSQFHASAGSWQIGNFISTANQVNCLATVGNVFAITGVQLEAGSLPTTFEHRHIGIELSLCQRYFNRLNIADGFYRYVGASGSFALATVPFPSMRSAPSATLISGGASGVASSPAFSASNGFLRINATASGVGEAALNGNPVIDLSAEL